MTPTYCSACGAATHDQDAYCGACGMHLAPTDHGSWDPADEALEATVLRSSLLTAQAPRTEGVPGDGHAADPGDPEGAARSGRATFDDLSNRTRATVRRATEQARGWYSATGPKTRIAVITGLGGVAVLGVVAIAGTSGSASSNIALWETYDNVMGSISVTPAGEDISGEAPWAPNSEVLEGRFLTAESGTWQVSPTPALLRDGVLTYVQEYGDGRELVRSAGPDESSTVMPLSSSYAQIRELPGGLLGVEDDGDCTVIRGDERPDDIARADTCTFLLNGAGVAAFDFQTNSTTAQYYSLDGERLDSATLRGRGIGMTPDGSHIVTRSTSGSDVTVYSADGSPLGSAQAAGDTADMRFSAAGTGVIAFVDYSSAETEIGADPTPPTASVLALQADGSLQEVASSPLDLYSSASDVEMDISEAGDVALVAINGEDGSVLALANLADPSVAPVVTRQRAEVTDVTWDDRLGVFLVGAAESSSTLMAVDPSGSVAAEITLGRGRIDQITSSADGILVEFRQTSGDDELLLVNDDLSDLTSLFRDSSITLWGSVPGHAFVKTSYSGADQLHDVPTTGSRGSDLLLEDPAIVGPAVVQGSTILVTVGEDEPRVLSVDFDSNERATDLYPGARILAADGGATVLMPRS